MNIKNIVGYKFLYGILSKKIIFNTKTKKKIGLKKKRKLFMNIKNIVG